MKTFLRVNLSLAPAVLFWALAGYGLVAAGLEAGAALGLAIAFWNLRHGRVFPMEAAMAAYLSVGALAAVAGFTWDMAIPGSFLALAATGFAACLAGRPWTSDYSAAENAETRETRLFTAINMGMSLLWSGLYLVLAGLGFARAPAGFATAIVLVGAAVSALAPKYAIRYFLRRAIAARESFHWRPTPFDAPDAPRDENHVDVAVVGAGIGGLTAAALLARSGLRVFVAEQHNVPGGYCHTWLRKGRIDGEPRLFRFDSGVHDVSGAHPGGSVSGVFAKLGLDIDWARMRSSTLIDGALAPEPEDWREHARLLGARHPASAGELMRFFETAKQLYDGLYFGADKTHGVPLGPRDAEAMLAFAKAQPLVVRWIDKPFAELVATFALDPAARAELYQLANYVTDREEEMTVLDMIPLYGYVFNGGYYPSGGSGVLGERLAEAIARDGGEVALKSPVAEIVVEDGAARGLRLASGRIVTARAVISNADLKRTFTELVDANALPAGFRESVAATEPATSAFMVHLGLDRQPDMTEIARIEGEDGFGVYAVSPSLADESAAPKGCGTLELIRLVPYAEARDWFQNELAHDDKRLRFTDAYEAKKRALGDRMIAVAERALPGLSSSIALRVDASPLTFQRYDWSIAGSIYGVAKKDRFRGLKGPIRDLWLAGAGNGGPGVEAVLIAGAAVAEALRPGALSRP